MMTPEQLNEFAGYLALTGAVPALGGFLTYAIGRPRVWYRSLLGWVMFALFGSLASVFGFIVARRLAGEFPGYAVWATAIYSITTLALWAVWVIIIVERRRGTRDKGKDTPK